MKVIPFTDWTTLISDLSNETVQVIHSTTKIQAIQKLLTVHEILELNLEIQKKFEEYYNAPPWDKSSLQDLNQVRRELFIYHRADFDPTKVFEAYNNKLARLVNFASNTMK